MFTNKLWIYKDIVGYNNLAQVFRSQAFTESKNYPMLRKILSEKRLLAITKHLPGLFSLRTKLLEKSMVIYEGREAQDLSISEFLLFIQKGKLSLRAVIYVHSFRKEKFVARKNGREENIDVYEIWFI